MSNYKCHTKEGIFSKFKAKCQSGWQKMKDFCSSNDEEDEVSGSGGFLEMAQSLSQEMCKESRKADEDMSKIAHTTAGILANKFGGEDKAVNGAMHELADFFLELMGNN